MKRTVAVLCALLAGAALPALAQVSTDYRVQMSDGVYLEATLVTPTTTQPDRGYPVIVFVHGLGGNKDDVELISTILTNRGFASLLYSVRGQGTSGGVSTIMGERETEDLREILMFLQTVPGLNPDTIGIAGGSQGGVHAWLAAIHHMPGVRTIATLVAPPTYSSDMMPNDCLKQQFCFELTLGAVRYDQVRDRIRDFVVREEYDSVRTFLAARDLSPLLDSVRIPVAQSLGWADVVFSANGGLRAAQNLAGRSVPVWSYFGTNGHSEPINITEYLFTIEMMLGWFDHWLRGTPLAGAEIPRIILADDRPAWPHREFSTWPPQDAATIRLYFSGASLQTSPPAVSGQSPFAVRYDTTYHTQQAWDQRYSGAPFLNAFQATPVRFVSAPLLDTLDATGIPEARLFLRADASRFQAHVRLFDVADNDTGSTWSLVSRCNNGVRGGVTGVTVERHFEGQAFSHLFAPGHRLGVEISGLDMYDATRPHIIPYFQSASAELATSPSYPSYVDLPLIGSAHFTSVPVASQALPASFTLWQNYPNPFNPSTTIRFALNGDQEVGLEVFTITGQRVATLLQGRLTRGEHQILFSPRALASGVYIARLTVAGTSREMPMVLLR